MNENPTRRLRLHGFNNLTKTLSFNLYDICYARTSEDRDAYLAYIDEQYNADRLTTICSTVAEIIGATVLSVSKQDYDPQGSSVTILISEEGMLPVAHIPASVPEIVGAHLDKSHITVHTYPESHPMLGISTFRADIDVSTCGRVSPLNALEFMIRSFSPDMMTLDYRVRGFTRDITGRKLFIDHPMQSIQHFIPDDLLEAYNMVDVNVYPENIFHTKCKLRTVDPDDYLFGVTKDQLHPGEINRISQQVRREMDEIYYGRNFTSR